MATAQVVDEFANFLGRKRDDLSADTFKAVLTNTAPTKAGTQILTDISQIAATGGYAAVTLTGVTWAETGAGTGIWQFTSSAFSWTPSGADFATARYIAIYDDTSTNDDVVCFVDIGVSTIIPNGTTFTITPGVNGIFRMMVS